jgi:hypothetical protein
MLGFNRSNSLASQQINCSIRLVAWRDGLIKIGWFFFSERLVDE